MAGYIQSIKQRDPACRGGLEAVLLYPGVHAVFCYRIAHFLLRARLKFLARLVSNIGRFFTGIEIHPGATIGKGLFIDHGLGVVIGETCVIGDYCTLYQGVTLGGTGKETGKRHPTLGDGVIVGSGALLLGNITIGDHAKVAAGAVVLGHVPPGATAVGVPARMIGADAPAGPQRRDPDWRHIPDPVSQEICRLERKIEELEKLLSDSVRS